MDVVLALDLVSVVTGTTAALVLYIAGLGVTWDQQTWGGESDEERSIKGRQRVMRWIGIPCVLATAACQVASILLSS